MPTEETTETTAITEAPQRQPIMYEDNSGDVMRSSSGFAHAWRVAQMFAESALVPDHLRGRVSDVAVVLLMAWRLNEDPLVMMQHTHIVKGKAGFAAQYVIARANRSDVFHGRIKYRETGKPGDKEYAVTAYATLAETGEDIEFTASMAMARAEGWTKNSKYQSMPQVMLRYRAATLLVRLNAPDVMLGSSTAEEIEDTVVSVGHPQSVHRPELRRQEPIARPKPVAVIEHDDTHEAMPAERQREQVYADNEQQDEGEVMP